MIPILYESTEKQFNTLGLGALKDCKNPFVTEERNGLFYFEMKYPINGINFEELELERIIVCDTSPTLKNQRFVITRISSPINGLVEVYAEHINQYKTVNTVLKDDIKISGNASMALSAWKASVIGGDEFTFDSNIETVSKMNLEIKNAVNARVALGGVRGSILDLYGGEYLFDNMHIRLLKSRGLDRGVRIDYGNNLLDFEQDKDITDIYTSIAPYVILTDVVDGEYKEKLLTLPEKVVYGENAKNFIFRKIKTVEFDEKSVKDIETLRNVSIQYLKNNNAGIPKNKIDLSFIDLSDTLNFEGLEKVKDRIELCDTLTLNFPKNKLYDVKMKVVLVKWNVSIERYEKIVVGAISSRFQANIVKNNNLDSLINDEIPALKKEISSVRVSANGMNLTFTGETEPIANNVGDKWVKKLPNGDKELYIWDGAVWKPLITEEEFIKLQQDLDNSKQLISEAKDTADKTLEEIETVKANAMSTESSVKDLLSYKISTEQNMQAIKADILSYDGKLKEIETDITSGTTYERINKAFTTATRAEQTLAAVKKTADGAVQVTAYNAKISTIDKDIQSIFKQVDPTDSSSLAYKLNETIKTVDGQVRTLAEIKKSLDGTDGTASLTVIKETLKEHSRTFLNLPKNIVGTVEVNSKGVPIPPFKKGMVWYKGAYNFTQGYDIFKSTDKVTLDEFMNAGTFICKVDRETGVFSWNDWERVSNDSKFQMSDIYQSIDTIRTTVQNNENNSKSQFLQLSSMIDQTVTKGDLIGQINTQAGNVLLRASADGKTSVLNLTSQGTYMDRNFVKESHIDIATITDALLENIKFNWAKGKTIDAKEIFVINLDASNIVTGKMKADYIQSGVITSRSGYWNLDTGVFINGRPTNSYISLSYGGLTMGFNYVTAMTLDHTGIRLHSGEREEIAGSFRLSSWASSGQPTISIIHEDNFSIGFFYYENGSSNIYMLMDKTGKSGHLQDVNYPIEIRTGTHFRNNIKMLTGKHLDVGDRYGLKVVHSTKVNGMVLCIGDVDTTEGIIVGRNGQAFIRYNGGYYKELVTR